MALADDHPLLLDGLEALLRTVPDFEVVARCTDGNEALRLVDESAPDILVLDLKLAGLDGHRVLERLRERQVATRVVVLTASVDEEELFEAVRLGARGVVLKEMAPRLLIDCLRQVHAGKLWLERLSTAHGIERLLQQAAGGREAAGRLTARELQIVRLIGEGLRNRQIGEKLFISEGTVKVHLHNIYDKLDVDGRLALLRLAEKRGWL